MDKYEELNPIGEETDGGEQDNEDLQENTQNDEGNDDSATSEGEGHEPAEDAAQQEAEKTRKFNAAMKAARLAGEKAAEERLGKSHSERIANMRLPNPEKPGEYFTTIEQMEEYSKNYRRAQAEVRAKREQRSVDEIIEEDENRAFLTRQRKEAETAKNRPQADNRSALQAHLSEMQERFPNVDILKLEQNRNFRAFCGSRYGKESLADLYESYTELIGSTERATVAKAQSKAQRDTGGASGKGSATLTSAQKAALQRWNENNPDMKMTEKEFMERG